MSAKKQSRATASAEELGYMLGKAVAQLEAQIARWRDHVQQIGGERGISAFELGLNAGKLGLNAGKSWQKKPASHGATIHSTSRGDA